MQIEGRVLCMRICGAACEHEGHLQKSTLLSTGAVSLGMRPLRSSHPTPVQMRTSFSDAAHVAARTT